MWLNVVINVMIFEQQFKNKVMCQNLKQLHHSLSTMADLWQTNPELENPTCIAGLVIKTGDQLGFQVKDYQRVSS